MAPSTTDWIAATAAGIAAVGTVGTLIAGLVQISNERSARRRDEAAARRRERRAQAELVSAWPMDQVTKQGRTGVVLLNNSESPVYRAFASLVMIQGSGPRSGRQLHEHLRQYQTSLSLIPPGRSYTSVAGGWGGMSKRPAIELAFTDRAGVHWLRLPDGTLSELISTPVEYYEITPPLSWEVPSDAL